MDNTIITLIPVILGDGKPLFGPLGADILLTCVGTKSYEFGFVQIQYTVVKDA